MTDETTQFPLHATVGIQVTQTLFLGPKTLIVEGNADLVYLQEMSKTLAAAGRTGLDDRWVLLPVGGLDKMPTFLALLGPQLYVAALHDGKAGGVPRLQDLVDKGIVDSSQVVAVTDFADGSEADLEDLFTRGVYLQLLRESGAAEILVKDITSGAPRVVAAVEQTLGHGFSHYLPARHLARHPDFRANFKPATLDSFERLFSHLNSLLT